MTATEITKQLDKEVKTFFNLIQPEIKREHPYPDNVSIQEVNIVDLPLGWNSFPHQLSTRQIGDRLAAENKTCLIKVPSAVTKGDFNILINTNHIEFGGVKIAELSPFPFDKRIFK